MTEIEYVTLKGRNEEYVCSQMEYPYMQAGRLYIKLVVLHRDTHEPIHFMIVEPENILFRRHDYTDEHLAQLVAASEAAAQYEMARMEEMAQQTPAPEPVTMEPEHPPEGGDPTGMFE